MLLEQWQDAITRALHADSAIGSSWAASRIEIHRGNVIGARVAALANHYPATCDALGGHFGPLAEAYAFQTAQLERDLNLYGDTFPGWVAAAQRKLADLRAKRYLHDLARLERALQEAYYAPDEAGHFPAAELTLGRAAKLRLQPSSSLRLLRLHFAVDRAHRAWLRERRVPAIGALRRQRWLVVWRRKGLPTYRAVGRERFQALTAVGRGRTLEEIAAMSTPPACFRSCILRGWIVGCRRIA